MANESTAATVTHQIKHRYTDAVLFECDVPDGMESGLRTRFALESATKAGANLSGACLSSANLSGANLSSADLSGADLSGANLSGAYLSSANLSIADLSGADLSGACLSGANLSGAYLSGACLSSANLSIANLSGANLSIANLSGANLSIANLSGACLSSANLSGACLSSANLSIANLSGANLSSAKEAALPIARTRILGEGSLIGWKKCANGVIVKLRIPEDAKRSHAWGRKCRAEFADVLEVFGAKVGSSIHDYGRTQYVAGQRVTPHAWCDDWTQECAAGIHFYISRIEAEAHQ